MDANDNFDDNVDAIEKIAIKATQKAHNESKDLGLSVMYSENNQVIQETNGQKIVIRKLEESITKYEVGQKLFSTND